RVAPPCRGAHAQAPAARRDRPWLALPGADLGVVDPLAPGVTEPALVSFPGFMRLRRVLVAIPFWLLLFLLPSPPGPSPTAHPPPTPPPRPPPSPSPSSSPLAQNAFLSLDVTDGGPTTQIIVNGGAFLSNEQMTLFWDQPNKVAGGAAADGSGNFVTHVKPFSGDPPGQHKLCASVEPRPCASFQLEAAATSPSPSASPIESPSPSPEATASPTASSTPVAATLNGLDLISRPPFVFLPIVGGLAILLSLGYWAVSVIRRPRPMTALPSAAVMHRS